MKARTTLTEKLLSEKWDAEGVLKTSRGMYGINVKTVPGVSYMSLKKRVGNKVQVSLYSHTPVQGGGSGGSLPPVTTFEGTTQEVADYLNQKFNLGESTLREDNEIGVYRGYPVFFAVTSYNCPKLKLFGYRNDYELKRAIDKKLGPGGTSNKDFQGFEPEPTN